MTRGVYSDFFVPLSSSKDMPLVMPTIPKLGLAEERERLLRSQAPQQAVAAEANRFDQAKARLDALRAQQQKPEKSVPYSVRKPNWWPGELSPGKMEHWEMGSCFEAGQILAQRRWMKMVRIFSRHAATFALQFEPQLCTL